MSSRARLTQFVDYKRLSHMDGQTKSYYYDYVTLSYRDKHSNLPKTGKDIPTENRKRNILTGSRLV